MSWERLKSKSGKLIGFVLVDKEPAFAVPTHQDGKPHDCKECGKQDKSSNLSGFCEGCVGMALAAHFNPKALIVEEDPKPDK